MVVVEKMKKRLLPVNPVNSNTENNKRADVETANKTMQKDVERPKILLILFYLDVNHSTILH